MLRCTSKMLISFFSNALDVTLQNQYNSFLKPHSNLVLIECNTETHLVILLVCYFIEIKIQNEAEKKSWGRVLKDQLLRFRATFINTIRHYDVIKAGNHGDRSRCSLSYNTFFNFSRTIRNTTYNYITSPMLVTYPSLNCLMSTSTSWLVPPQPYKGIWQQQESQVTLKAKPGFPLLILML